MAFNDTPGNSQMTIDRSSPVGNSPGADDRGRLHVKLANTVLEPVPISITGGGVLAGITWDWFSVAYPTLQKEVYTFFYGGSGGIQVAVVELNYSTPAKSVLISGGRIA